MRHLTTDELARLSPQDLAAYEALLEEEYYGVGRESFLEFVRRVEVPGAPVPDTEDFYPEKVSPAAHHRLIIDCIQKMADGKLEVDGIMVFCPPGAAKALDLDTPIPTPDGWRRMGDLRVGDKVFDEHGIPCNVTWVSQVWKDRPVYRVTTDCGDEIIADQDHEWLVCLCRKQGKFAIKETKDLARRRSKRPMIRRAGALELPDVDLPIAPYTLGVWLGDGTGSSGQITLNDGDSEHIIKRIEREGYEVRKNGPELRWHIHGIRGALVEAGLLRDTYRGIMGRKHIPQIYLRASRSQRMELLRGLVDTDGHVTKRGEIQFTSTSCDLAHGVLELVRSLGVKASIGENRATLNGKDCGPCWRVYFRMSGAAHVPRKASECRDGVRTPNTYIDVDLLDERRDTVCIEVDSPSHLFLCGRSMTPTHNSTYVSVLAPPWLMGRRPRTNVIATSYGQDLANRFGRRVRQIVRSEDYTRMMGCTITEDNQAVTEWSLTNGSDYRASGLGGTITGLRADFLFIDDPVKDREEADSQLIRDKRWEAYLFSCDSRLKPGGKIFIVQTRWHEDDLSGRLLGEDWKGQSGVWRCTDGRKFLVVNLPLISEHDDDPLGRKPGELLWPEWFRMEDAKRRQENAKKGGTFARTWSSLYQQTPAPSEGAILSRSYWRRWKDDELPECDRVFLCYDTAFEADEEADYSAMTAWGVFGAKSKKADGLEFHHDHVILLGAWQDKVSAVDLLDIVKDHCKLFRPDRVLVEKRASGIQLVQELKRQRIPVQAWLPRGQPGAKGKIPRAHAVAAILEQGSVWYVPGTKTDAVLDQCAAFPYGKNDDSVDTVTMALSWFRDHWIFKTADDELDPDEIEEALLARSDRRRQSRRLYSSRPTRSRGIDLDADEIANMTDETRRKLW